MLKVLKFINTVYERVVTILLIIVLLMVAWCAYDNYYIFNHTLNDSISWYRPGNNDNNIPSGEKDISDDMVAWLTIYNTDIDYPIMQFTDNVKYLNTDPFGDYSISGSIFLDSRNSSDFSDQYNIVYGHHMDYNKMFGPLDNYLDAQYLSDHSFGEILIGKEGSEKYSLEIFASAYCNVNDSCIFDTKSSDTDSYIRNIANVYNENVNKTDKIICLSTCSDESYLRIVVFGYLKQ